MKVRVKMICDIEVDSDADGGTVGVRDALAMRVEGILAPDGRVRYVEILPVSRRLTQCYEDGARYVGECEYIPCDRRGKCLDGAACAGCAHADVMRRMAVYENVLCARG